MNENLLHHSTSEGAFHSEYFKNNGVLYRNKRLSNAFNSKQRLFQREMLTTHNKYRARHCAPALKLDDEISRSAQRYAERIAKLNAITHDKTHNLGENIWKMSSSSKITSVDGAQVTRKWYDEIRQYQFEKQGFTLKTGHFTQLIWKNSKKLGIGFATTKDGRSIYVVARYSPAGNVRNHYNQNVSPAKC